MPDLNLRRVRTLPNRICGRLQPAGWWILAGVRFPAVALGRAKPALFAVGDSHANSNFGNDPRIHVRYLGPMTMHRIARDGRRAISLNRLGIFRRDIVIWCFGEIDVRCHLIKQRDLQRISIPALADSLARDYLRSIAAIQAEIAERKTVILAVIPPTDRGNNADFPKVGSLEERVNARKLLNAALEKYSSEFGFTYLDPYGPFTDPSGGLKLEMSDGSVHCGSTYAPLIVQKVADAVAPWLENPPA
jgi:hypothetical protein